MKVSRDAVRPWLISRAAVLMLMAFAAYIQARHGYGRSTNRGGDGGFYAWDADWYRRIARDGYVLRDSLRFFPLVSLPGRLLSPLGGFVAGAAVVVVSNVSALAYAEGLSRLTLAELRDETAARWVPWFALLSPVAYVLVIGYAEATAVALAVWCFLALRRRAWLLAAALAFLSGLSRPTGVLVALPALIEALRGVPLRAWLRPTRDLASRALAVAAAPLGCAAFLAWVWVARGDPFLPFEAQQLDNLRNGIVVWPGDALWTAWMSVRYHGLVTHMLHLIWVPFSLALLVAVGRRLPASYTAYSAAVLFFAIGTPRLASVERYTVSAFPLLMVLATTRPRRVRVVTLAVCCVGLAGYAVLAFTHKYVP